MLEGLHDVVEGAFRHGAISQLPNDVAPLAEQVAALDGIEHGAKFCRNAWEGEQGAIGAQLEGEAGGHPGTVVDKDGAFGQKGHLPVPRIELGGTAPNGHVEHEHAILHLPADFPVIAERPIERVGERDVGSVIRRGPESTADEDARQVGLGEMLSNGAHDVIIDIAHGRDQARFESTLKKPGGQPIGIGVNGEPAQDLIADDHDAGARHGSIMTGVPRSAYERSKGLETVTWRQFPLGRGLALSLLEQESAAGRQADGQALLNALDEAAGLPPCKLTVADRPQRHRTRDGRLALKTYGYYRIAWESVPRRGSIRIYNLTAIRQQVLAPKVFLETLLHEWVHHYDFTGLELDRSPHTSGFYARIRDLAETLGVGFVPPPTREMVGVARVADDVTVTSPDR